MLPDGFAGVTVAAAIEEWDSAAIEDGKAERGEVTLFIQPGKIRACCQFLKQKLQFERLSNVTAVDRLPAEPRFEIVYHLHSIERSERLRLVCRLGGGNPEIDSVVSVWSAADWYEREVFDLFGVAFKGHPNLKRLLMPEDWVGHPLRKDFPVHGKRYEYRDE